MKPTIARAKARWSRLETEPAPLSGSSREWSLDDEEVIVLWRSSDGEIHRERVIGRHLALVLESIEVLRGGEFLAWIRMRF